MNRLRFIWRLAIALSATLRLTAQPDGPPPTGVWCSCPPTTPAGSSSVVPGVALKSYVNGILLRVVWKDIEPEDGSYNWALIDGQIASAQAYGKKIALAVGTGPNSPDWLYALGAQHLTYAVPFSGTIPVPWDLVFLEKWSEFITALGNRYADDTTIQLVYMTHSSTNGFEMQLPLNPTPSYAALAYTEQQMIDSWAQIIDLFNSAFPNHYLTNDFHPVNGSNAIADSVYAYAKLNVGSRYGANGWWWTQHNTTVYPSQYSILQDSSESNLFTGIQMAHSGTSSGDLFGAGGMPAALDLAVANHICYWEIWNSDIVSGVFDEMLSNASCLPLGVPATPNADGSLRVFPNPSQDVFTVAMANGLIVTITVVNALGQTVLQINDLATASFALDLSDKSAGLYVLKITTAQQQTACQKIIKTR